MTCNCPVPLTALVAERVDGNTLSVATMAREHGVDIFVDDIGRQAVGRNDAAVLMQAAAERRQRDEANSIRNVEANEAVREWELQRRDVVEAARQAVLSGRRATTHDQRNRARGAAIEAGEKFERDAPPEVQKRTHPVYLKSWDEATKKRHRVQDLLVR